MSRENKAKNRRLVWYGVVKTDFSRYIGLHSLTFSPDCHFVLAFLLPVRDQTVTVALICYAYRYPRVREGYGGCHLQFYKVKRDSAPEGDSGGSTRGTVEGEKGLISRRQWWRCRDPGRAPGLGSRGDMLCK